MSPIDSLVALAFVLAALLEAARGATKPLPPGGLPGAGAVGIVPAVTGGRGESR